MFNVQDDTVQDHIEQILVNHFPPVDRDAFYKCLRSFSQHYSDRLYQPMYNPDDNMETCSMKTRQLGSIVRQVLQACHHTVLVRRPTRRRGRVIED